MVQKADDRILVTANTENGYDCILVLGAGVREDGTPSLMLRDRLERGDDTSEMLDKDVRDYIRSRGLWTLASKITMLTAAIERNPECGEHYLERGKCYFRREEWGKAINDMRRAAELMEDKTEATQYIALAEEILNYRYKDIYNP